MLRIYKRIFSVLSVIVLSSVCLWSQEGAGTSYSPYSIFGIGSIEKEGTAYNKTLGGTGVATRNNRFINTLNPASLTARDTLSFMMDFGLTSENKVFSQNGLNSANNEFNISDIVISFPIYGKNAVSLGITPYSSVSYNFAHDVSDLEMISQVGNINYTSKGTGGLYKLYISGATMFFKRLSVGAEFDYYFGNISKKTAMTFDTKGYKNINSGYALELTGATGKFGLQYDQPLGTDLTMTVGVTYRLATKLRGTVKDFKYASSSNLTDTLSHSIDTLNGNAKIADEIGFGLSLKKGDNWRAEINYIRSDWNQSGFASTRGFSNLGATTFSPTVSESLRAGFEIVPNRNDIRYYLRRCSYRVGTYYDKEYYRLDGNLVSSYGLTLGVTLPVFRWYNGISLGVDVGKRGSVKGNQTRELYTLFVVGFNIHDIWFQKPRYD